MRKTVRNSILAAFVSLIAACGGANNIGTGTTTPTTPDTTTCPAGQTFNVETGVCFVFPGSTAATVTAIRLTSSAVALPSDADTASEGITLTVVATDANNNTVTGAAVSFIASSGALIISSPTTDSAGMATATLTTGGDSTLRNITVRATQGSLTAGPLSIQVVAPTTPIVPVPALGNGLGGSYADQVIRIAQSNLAAGGSTALHLDLVDRNSNNSALTSQTPTIAFSSPCITQRRASVTSPSTITGGSLDATYISSGCSGADQITATATLSSGTQLTAVGNVTVTAAPISSVQFSSVSTNSIRIKGTGDPQTAVVAFIAKDTAGGPVENQTVRFSLDTTAGGITFSPANGITDSAGRVQVTVSAGTVATSVRVTATAIDAGGTPVSGVPPAQSDSLVISTGLADQNSFSISAGCFNIEGGDYDGTTTPINIYAADRFNNPVPNGTAIAFRTEGGQITSQCLTNSGGFCTVNFTSASPRTADHRVTVLATAIGEESFTDTNGNGQYDTGEAFTDLPEAFLDKNENLTRENTEEFVDFNNNGNYNAASGNFTGVLCNSGCDTATSVSVRADLPIIMSGSVATLVLNPSTVDLSNGPVAVQVTMNDSAGQPMPFGTVLSATTSFGTIVGDASYTQACSSFNGPFVYTFVLQPPMNQATSTSGVLSIKATTPKGVVTATSASVNYTVGGTTTPPPPGNLKSISSVSVSNSLISIKGTGVGQPETTAVTFKVFDDQGNALSGQSVGFSLDTNAGDITLDKTSTTSGSDGTVLVNLSSGTVHTSVRVFATATSGSTTVRASSDTIVISTAIPDQDSFSLSATQLNIEGTDYDGITTTITARLADRFNNPVPDGTSVSFTAEGGSIQPQCATTGGACSVTWTSQNPRVADHRYTVLATASGEESFTDLNGNGSFDSTDLLTTDLPEAFLDRNKDGVRQAASEEFVDFDNDRAYDAASGNFTGVLCNSGCDMQKFVSVRGDLEIIFSGSTANITTSPSTLTFAATTDPSRAVNVTVQDSAGQAMAPGTTISATTDYGSVIADNGTTSYTQKDTTTTGSLQVYTFTVSPDATTPTKKGRITITVTSPKGIISQAFITVN